MKNSIPCLLIVSLVFFFACERGSPSPNGDPGKGTPTEIGKPIGAAVSQMIGPEGGAITSPNGKLTLEFPEGALKESKTITIQPVENTAWNGIGQGFEFGPDGSRFEKPVTFTYNYTDEEMAGSSPDMLGLAFQRADRVWQLAQPVKVDKVKKTITGRINHFSWWSLVTKYRLTPEVDSVVLTQTKELTLETLDYNGMFDSWAGKVMPAEFETDKMLFLSLPRPADRSDISGIYLNGIDFSTEGPKEQTYGSVGHILTGKQAKILYTAPGKMPKENNPVAIAVELRHTGKAKLMLVSNIDILFGDELSVGGHTTENVSVTAARNGQNFSISILSLDAPATQGVSLTLMTNRFSEGKFGFDLTGTVVNAMNGVQKKGGSSHYTHCGKAQTETGFVTFDKIYTVDGQQKIKGSVIGKVVVKHADDQNCNHTEHETMLVAAQFDCVVRQ